MFSGSLNWLSHDERYAMADEFVTLMKWLWASEEPIDFQGKYYRSLGKLCTGGCAERLAESGHDNRVQRMEVE